jgi:hypothetical protein
VGVLERGLGAVAGTDQVTGRFLDLGRYSYRGDLAQAQQPGQVQCVPGIGLDPVPAGTLQLRGAATWQPMPAPVNAPASPNPVDSDSYSTDTGPGRSAIQASATGGARPNLVLITSPVTPSIAAAALDRMCTSKEVAFAIASLTSPSVAATTGTALTVDGGLTDLRLPPRT